MWFQALYRFFNNMTQPLNKNEPTQPPPLEVQRAHLIAELERVERAIKKRREFLEKK